MRCPKCHYISFDSGERCRNCGYDFSLSVRAVEDEFEIQSTPDGDPLREFSIKEPEPPSQPVRRTTPSDKAWPPPEAKLSEFELPLFTLDPDDDRPLVAPPSAPRPPLSVRRATPGPARPPTPAAEAPERPVSLSLDAEHAPESQLLPSSLPGGARADLAGPMRRLAAALIDGLLLFALDLGVVSLTLGLAGLSHEDLAMVPKVPLVSFLVLLNGGYLVLFTASIGQTIGKMALGIRVVDAAESPLVLPGIGQAALRALASVVSIAPFGLGYIPALLGAEGRALHDRLADTLVVKVG